MLPRFEIRIPAEQARWYITIGAIVLMFVALVWGGKSGLEVVYPAVVISGSAWLLAAVGLTWGWDGPKFQAICNAIAADAAIFAGLAALPAGNKLLTHLFGIVWTG